jgi:hypothetical protein
MATLTEDAKRHIVQALACFDTPTQVVESVKEEFGVDVLRNQVAQYDPTKVSGRSLSKKWRTLFEDTRKRFREEVAEIPIASRAFRLRALGRMAQQAEKSRNIGLAVQMIEQAAKEVGDVYVNRRLDAPKAPGDDGDGIPSAPEYTLKPDEDIPDSPIL